VADLVVELAAELAADLVVGVADFALVAAALVPLHPGTTSKPRLWRLWQEIPNCVFWLVAFSCAFLPRPANFANSHPLFTTLTP